MSRTARERGRPIVVSSAGVRLAGALWLPASTTPVAIVIMHPGSGPSDRDNDIFFPPIREHLVSCDVGVCSCDKRGVGGSTGRWQDADIADQATDVLATIELLRTQFRLKCPFGLFGHSQGGWVVLEAAARAPQEVAFVITSSGPGVSPGEQVRWAARQSLEDGESVRCVDTLVSLARQGTPFSSVERALGERGQLLAYRKLLSSGRAPITKEEWPLFVRIVSYDPAQAMKRVHAPVLAVFGESDPVVPVERSLAAYRSSVAPALLSIAVLPGGDHRLSVGPSSRLADGYLALLSEFIVDSRDTAAPD